MKLIELPHKSCDSTCMINGLEDIYTARTGCQLPDWFFFYMSGMGGFAYIKNRRAPVPYLVNWGTRLKDQYNLLAEVVGFSWQTIENRSFSFAFKQALQAIDRGQPVVLGALDMFHLPYFERFYHRYHIPYHYVLLVGYDPDRQVVFVHDCGREDVQEIPYAELQAAWEVHVPGISGPNTLFLFQFDDQPAGTSAIARQAISRKARFMLHPPAGMLGLKGMHKLARELPHWPQELDEVQLKASLNWLVEFTGSPPAPPARLYGCSDPEEDHTGLRQNFARLLTQLSETESEPTWGEAAALFAESGQAIQALTSTVVDYLLGKTHDLNEATALVKQSANLEEQAYQRLTSP